MLGDDRCPKCDRVGCLGTAQAFLVDGQWQQRPHTGHLDIDDPGDCPTCATIGACMANTVDWRARALAAESLIDASVVKLSELRTLLVRGYK